jgi:hypothetical protein
VSIRAFIENVDPAIHAAEAAIVTAVETWHDTGTTELVRDLVRTVWSTNLDRYEPEVLKDTPKALGVQCSENLRERAVELAREDPHWQEHDLRVTTPRSTLRLSVRNWHALTMKVPLGQARSPMWDVFDWTHDSLIRSALAERNSHALGGYRTSADEPLPMWGDLPAPTRISDLLLVWAGDPDAGLTAGWLTVPVLGAYPFAATAPLWWDEEASTPTGSRRDIPDGVDAFDQKPDAVARLALKPRPAADRQA